jgi:hypothetical protein
MDWRSLMTHEFHLSVPSAMRFGMMVAFETVAILSLLFCAYTTHRMNEYLDSIPEYYTSQQFPDLEKVSIAAKEWQLYTYLSFGALFAVWIAATVYSVRERRELSYSQDTPRLRAHLAARSMAVIPVVILTVLFMLDWFPPRRFY